MSISQRHETEIVLDPDLPVIHTSRIFEAPRTKVFRAHVDPELFVRWVGPHGAEASVDRWECRTGGSYRYLCGFGAEPHAFFGSFHEVRPDELIIQTFTYEGVPDGVILERLAFEDLGDGRSRLAVTSLLDSFEARDGYVASGMEGGTSEGYAKLDALLAV
jgi:uncharacterized protein YndB with AHSA1/START domain